MPGQVISLYHSGRTNPWCHHPFFVKDGDETNLWAVYENTLLCGAKVEEMGGKKVKNLFQIISVVESLHFPFLKNPKGSR